MTHVTHPIFVTHLTHDPSTHSLLCPRVCVLGFLVFIMYTTPLSTLLYFPSPPPLRRWMSTLLFVSLRSFDSTYSSIRPTAKCQMLWIRWLLDDCKPFNFQLWDLTLPHRTQKATCQNTSLLTQQSPPTLLLPLSSPFRSSSHLLSSLFRLHHYLTSVQILLLSYSSTPLRQLPYLDSKTSPPLPPPSFNSVQTPLL